MMFDREVGGMAMRQRAVRLKFQREAHFAQNVSFWKDTYLYAKIVPS